MRKIGPIGWILLATLGAFLLAFLVYPVAYVLKGGLSSDEGVSAAFVLALFRNPVTLRCILNSLALAVATTALTAAVAIPLAFLMRRRFRGKELLSAALLVPMVMPPFVGAIGIRRLLARFGSVNLLLMQAGLAETPVDWLGSWRFWGVVALEVLHLYPILYLNVVASLANISPTMEEAGRNMGASGLHLFRTITFPLMMPGFFAGASIIFIWAFTDLGTPLLFGYRQVVAVQIFDRVSDIQENPAGYALVILVILITAALFFAARWYVARGSYVTTGKAEVAAQEKPLRGWSKLVLLYPVALTALALLPHISVVLTALSDKWTDTVLPPEYTTAYFGKALTDKFSAMSIKNSLLYSLGSTAVDVAIGLLIGYLTIRKRIRGSTVLDAIAMLPLALPGLVLAFGYVGAFSGVDVLDPRKNPTALLIIAYAVRRMPYMVRVVSAGFQQISEAFEEASLNLGASPAMTFRRITVPLLAGNLIAGSLLCFSFAMLEVSDSLILAFREDFYPITKAIFQLYSRPTEGANIACAMGILAMGLLVLTLFIAGSFLGRKMGEMFRA